MCLCLGPQLASDRLAMGPDVLPFQKQSHQSTLLSGKREHQPWSLNAEKRLGELRKSELPPPMFQSKRTRSQTSSCFGDWRSQNCDSEFKGVKLLNTRSYHEHVKISAPNELDVMFKLKVPRIQLEEYCNTGAHYFVKFKRNSKGNPLKQFVEEEISASKMLLKFRKIIKEEIKNTEDIDIIMERERGESPAVKPEKISVDIILTLESKSSWLVSTQKGLPTNKWLGPRVRSKLRQKSFYLISQACKKKEMVFKKRHSGYLSLTLKNCGQTNICCETNRVKCYRMDGLKIMK
ncbi:Cyclic GMP-AMP synthase [Sciurus carolinensis]|uniref:Cyclic GMP-AMP synthase n=1 Tax=Sciurus carolinensis TaxID=30640 RepID=A0AA41NH10_SCICA|nr:Cyclic GMP-AMP synthase [Sciurus carolinensis]